MGQVKKSQINTIKEINVKIISPIEAIFYIIRVSRLTTCLRLRLRNFWQSYLYLKKNPIFHFITACIKDSSTQYVQLSVHSRLHLCSKSRFSEHSLITWKSFQQSISCLEPNFHTIRSIGLTNRTVFRKPNLFCNTVRVW